MVDYLEIAFPETHARISGRVESSLAQSAVDGLSGVAYVVAMLSEAEIQGNKQYVAKRGFRPD
jgi:hypothetical protein